MAKDNRRQPPPNNEDELPPEHAARHRWDSLDQVVPLAADEEVIVPPSGNADEETV